MQAVIDKSLVAFAHSLADAAGRVIAGHWQKPAAVEAKADASPVTEADKQAESAMRELIAKHYPAHGILGEEHGTINPDAEYQWVLDPIDGTRAFISGYPTFTTLIALVKNNVPVLGMIDQPIQKQRWLGISGQASLCNEKPVKVSGKTELKKSLIATTSTYYFTPPETQAFEKLRAQCGNAQLGGDAYAYAMLANGRIDLVVDAGLKPYDFCALKNVIEGAGGVITDWQGAALTLQSHGQVIAAASKELHAQALTFLQSATL